ncbi:MAG TPA: methyltransferase domain-containing protein [Polyangiaceae bacterium LLY-WYZ-15_(1-7)]|nr:methyltransferase domain-containing protein [Polyangiaceae bacterium LLY-WYZ-15_(1-7)]HJL33951.1 methyltransferase domain-containing protein [Polyangiaceae bacterium LLY-WYZ-15_(1-7)]HJL45338.1 methyltransferase domain-containing protein [Polyangiaceae bacterium LLY-WYZ-15_(1-7)]
MGNDDLDELSLRPAYEGPSGERYVERLAKPGLRRRLAIADRCIIDHVGSPESCLELGGGTGRLIEQIPARRRVSVDLSRTLGLKAPACVRTVQASNRRLPFADEAFDSVVSGYGGYRGARLDEVYAEMARVLRDRGTFGLHGFTRVRLGLRPLVSRRLPDDVGGFEEEQRRMFEHGLWLERSHVWRGTQAGFVPVPRKLWMLGSHAVLLGHRMKRSHAHRLRDLERKLARGRARVVVAGTSMESTIPMGEVVQVEKLTHTPPRGELVLIVTPDSLLVHRVRRVIAGRVIHVGDNLASQPASCARWRVWARVVA